MPNLTYIPEAGFVGSVSFTYQVTDQFGLINQATVTIEITNDIIFINGFENLNKAISLVNTMSMTGLLTQIILWRRK